MHAAGPTVPPPRGWLYTLLTTDRVIRGSFARRQARTGALVVEVRANGLCTHASRRAAIGRRRFLAPGFVGRQSRRHERLHLPRALAELRERGAAGEIGRASCRERVEMSVGAVDVERKIQRK